MLLAYLVWWLVFLIGLILIVFVSFVLTMLYPPLKVEMGIATLVLAFAVGICFSQIGQNIIIRQDGVFASIRNSVKLVNKNYWRTGIMIIISLLPAILLAPLRVYLLPHGYYMHYTYALLYLVFSVFAMPWVISVRLVYYRDLLIRKNWA